MTSVSSYSSPLQALQAQLSSSISAGTIKSADKDALTTALTDIDSSLNASRDSAKGKPGDVKQKVDDLIAQEVSDGKLTSDQADELKSVFEQTFAQGGPGGAGGAGGPGGPGGPGGAGGPPPGPPPDGDSDSTTSSSSTSSTTDASDLLQQFLKALQEKLNASSATYSASGTGSSSSSSSNSLVVDYTT